MKTIRKSLNSLLRVTILLFLVFEVFITIPVLGFEVNEEMEIPMQSVESLPRVLVVASMVEPNYVATEEIFLLAIASIILVIAIGIYWGYKKE